MTVRDTNSDIRVGIKSLFLCALEPEIGVTGNFQRARRDIAADIISGLNDKNLIILKATNAAKEPFVKAVYAMYRKTERKVPGNTF